jgi:hypothetical protein
MYCVSCNCYIETRRLEFCKECNGAICYICEKDKMCKECSDPLKCLLREQIKLMKLILEEMKQLRTRFDSMHMNQ